MSAGAATLPRRERRWPGPSGRRGRRHCRCRSCGSHRPSSSSARAILRRPKRRAGKPCRQVRISPRREGCSGAWRWRPGTRWRLSGTCSPLRRRCRATPRRRPTSRWRGWRKGGSTRRRQASRRRWHWRPNPRRSGTWRASSPTTARRGSSPRLGYAKRCDGNPAERRPCTCLGILQKAAGAFAAARATLLAAVAAAPGDPGILVTLGGVCLDLGLNDEARTRLEGAVQRGAQGAAVWDNLGLARRRSGDLVGAVAAFTQSVAADSAFVPALANLVQARKYLCDWDGLDALEQRLAALADDPASDPRLSPSVALGLSLSPEARLRAVRRWCAAMLPTPVAPPPPPPRSGPLRVGYLSSDFGDHPTGRLMVGLFEQHDRRRVTVHGYSYGPAHPIPTAAAHREGLRSLARSQRPVRRRHRPADRRRSNRRPGRAQGAHAGRSPGNPRVPSGPGAAPLHELSRNARVRCDRRRDRRCRGCATGARQPFPRTGVAIAALLLRDRRPAQPACRAAAEAGRAAGARPRAGESQSKLQADATGVCRVA